MKNVRLTPEQIKSIPDRINKEGKNEVEIAQEFKCHPRTIGYWIKRLRARGIEVKTKSGRRHTKLD